MLDEIKFYRVFFLSALLAILLGNAHASENEDFGTKCNEVRYGESLFAENKPDMSIADNKSVKSVPTILKKKNKNYSPNQVLLLFNKTFDLSNLAEFEQELGLRQVEKSAFNSYRTFEITDGEEVMNKIKQLENRSEISTVQPVFIYNNQIQ